MTTPKKLLNDITAGKFKPAYYFFGTEDYRISEAEKFVAKQFLPDLQRPSNYRRLNGKKTSSADIIAELSNLPILGERQVFSIDNIQSYSPKDIERILKILVPADSNRIVIFRTPSSKIPSKKTAFYKKMIGAVEAVEFKKLTSNETSSLIAVRLQNAGVNIQPEALTMLTSLVAGDRGGLEAEINKLLNFKEKGEIVEVADIEMISAGFEVFNIFELADFVIAGNTEKAIRMLKGLVADGNSPATIVTLLQQHFTCLYLVKNGRKPLPRREYFIYKYREQANRYKSEQLEELMVEIAKTDADLRKGGLKRESLLEMLILRLAGGK